MAMAQQLTLRMPERTNNVVEVEAAPHPQWLKLRLIGSPAYNYAEEAVVPGKERPGKNEFIQSCMEWVIVHEELTS